MEHGQSLALIHSHPQYPALLSVLERLKAEGFEAVLAGGCVRDGLLGRRPHDFDVATSARPSEVKQIFSETVDLGIAFGTVLVLQSEQAFEVTTFRKDGEYLDGRHPSSVVFSEMKEDALRRDFTINALFYDPTVCRIFDFVEGIKDLSLKRLRTVGRAEERFNEDKLRMLRAVRFVSQLGFSLDDEALKAIESTYSEIKVVAPERMGQEMTKLLQGTYLLESLRILKNSGLYTICFPRLTEDKINRLAQFSGFVSWENAFAALCFPEFGTAKEQLKAWKLRRESMQDVDRQMQALSVLLDKKSSKGMRIRALGESCLAEILVLADGLIEDHELLQNWIQDYLSVADKDGVLPKPFLSGHDLLEMGLHQGPKFRFYLDEAYDLQLEGELEDKHQALEWLKNASQI